MTRLLILLAFLTASGCEAGDIAVNSTPEKKEPKVTEQPSKTDIELSEKLTPRQFHVTQEKGTEFAYSGKYWNCTKDGVYHCICCGRALFDSKAKYDSGCGWPSFYEPVSPGNVATKSDTSYGMARTEVLCGNCGAHLGHVFDDGPPPTGRRYCINSASLNLVERKRPEGE